MRTTLRSKLVLLFMSFALLLAMPAMALADTLTVSNTLVTNTDTSKAPGDTGTANVWLDPTNNDPTTPNDATGCNAGSGTEAATVTLSSTNSAISFPNGNSAQLTACGSGNAKQITYKVADNAQAGQAVIKGAVTGGKSGQTNQYNINDTLTVTITAPAKQNTTVSLDPTSGTYGGSATLKATLKTAAGAALSGKSVDFKLNGTSVGSGTTDASGVATKSVSLTDIDANTYTNYVSANFAGDATNNGSTASGNLTVNKAQATLTLNNLTGHTYDGSAKAATVSTSPAGLSGASITYDGSAQAPTNAGSYNVVANLNNQNYEANNATGTMVIAKATPQITWSNPADITYGTQLGASQLNASANVAGSFSYTPASGTKLDAGAAQQLKADFTPTNTTNYNGASKTVQINVNKADQAITFGALANKTFGDADFALSASSDSGLDVSFASKTQAKCSVSNGSVSILEAGTCTIEASQGGNANFNAATSVSRSFQIAKKTAPITLSDLAHTYDGSAKAAKATTNPAGLNVGLSYSQDGQAVAEPKNAGDYQVVATINETNYEGSKTGTLSIAKADQAITFGALANKTFGDADFNVSAQGGNSGNPVTFAADGNCTVQGSTVSITGAGSCKITASQAGNSNYNAAPSVERTFSIAKKAATLSLSGLSKVYDGQPQAATVDTTPAGLNGVSITYDGNAQAPTNAGSYAVVAKLNNPNYEAAEKTGTLVIAKATAQVSLSGLAHTYDGTVKAASASTTPSNLKVDLEYKQNGVVASPKNAGSYAVVASVNDANYEGSKTGTLVINKAKAEIILSGLSKVYDGQPQGATVTTDPDVPNKQLTVTYNGSAQVPTNAGSYDVVASLNDANYEAAEKTGTLVIEKAQAQVNLGGLSRVYDGQPQGVSVGTTPANLNVNVSYDGNAQAPTNAGSYAVVATVDNPNYKGQATGTLDIAKAVPQVLITWANSTYDGTANAARATVSGVGNPPADLGVADSLAYYSASGTALPGAPKDAGTYTVEATFGGAANYRPASASKTITIAKANPVVTWSNPAPIEYGTALSGAQLNAQANVAGSFTYTPAAGTVLKAGTQTLKADFAPADSGNYNNANAQAQIVVNPYAFTGFFQPIDNSIYNSAKAGSTIPVKFSLGGDKGMNILAATPTAAKVNCDPNLQVDAIEELSTATTSGLKYDPLAGPGGQYIYNWKTATSYAGTCQQLFVRLADGTTAKSALFKFTK